MPERMLQHARAIESCLREREIRHAMTACVSASALELLRLASEDTESAVPCASKLSAAAQCVSEQVPREDTLLAPKLEGQAAPAGHKSANNPKYLASVVDPTGREVEFEFDDDEIRASGEDVLHKMEVADPDGRTIALNIFARDLADPATAVKKFCDLQSGHGRRGPTVGAWDAWAVDTCAREVMRNLAPTLDRLRGRHAFPMAVPTHVPTEMPTTEPTQVPTDVDTMQLSAARTGRFAANRNNLSTEAWSRGMWGLVAVPEKLLSRFSQNVVPFPESTGVPSCTTKCGPSPNPMIHSINTRSGIEIVVNSTCAANLGVTKIVYCAISAHPEMGTDQSPSRNESTRWGRLGAIQSGGLTGIAVPGDGCSENVFGDWKPGTLIPSEAVRVISESVDGSQDWSTFVGCIPRADLERDRMLHSLSIQSKKNCTSQSKSASSPANVDQVIVSAFDPTPKPTFPPAPAPAW